MTTKILIVDDNPDVLELLSRRLGLAGYITVEASNGYEGLAQLEKDKFDLVVLDVMMPSMSGYEVLQAINEKYTAPPPVILFSAVEDVDDLVKGKETKEFAYVVKSTSGSQVLQTVFKALSSCGRRVL